MTSANPSSNAIAPTPLDWQDLIASARDSIGSQPAEESRAANRRPTQITGTSKPAHLLVNTTKTAARTTNIAPYCPHHWPDSLLELAEMRGNERESRKSQSRNALLSSTAQGKLA